MTIVHLSDLPEDVREHLAALEQAGDEFPESFQPLEPPDDDYGFPDEA